MNGYKGFIEVEVAKSPDLSSAEIIEDDFRSQPINSPHFECNWLIYYLFAPLGFLMVFYVMIKKGIYNFFGYSGPQINCLFFDGWGTSNRKIKEGAASWKALDIIYNHQFGASIRNLIDDFWIKMMNAQAVRNRYKLVRQEVKRAVLRFDQEEEIRLISLACGSAQAIIEIISEFKQVGVVLRVVLIDIDQNALDYASSLSEKFGVSEQVTTKKASVSQILEISKDFRPHIVEMLGLLDYLSQEKAIRLAKKIFQSLEPGGFFLTCNIAPNIEMFFLRWVIDWPMIYRYPRELVEISCFAGFKSYRLVYEPLRIHGILIAEK